MLTFGVSSGGQFYELPDFETAKVGFDFSEASSFGGTYPVNGVNANKLVDRAVIISKMNGTELDNGRYQIRGGKGSAVGDYTFDIFGFSLHFIFQKTRTKNPAGKEKSYVFTTQTAGAILHTLFTHAQARGAMTGITWNFSATLDSEGLAWPTTIDQIDFKPGLRYSEIIRNFVDVGLIEVKFVGTQFQVFQGEGMGTTRSTILRAGVDYEETPYKWSTESLTNYAMTIGDEQVVVDGTNAGVPVGPFGIEEEATSQSGTKSTGALTVVNQHFLNSNSTKREEFTRSLLIRSDGPVPCIDYQVGDWIKEDVGAGETLYRVRNIVLTVEGDGSVRKANLVLNDMFLEMEIQTARKVSGILGGSSSSSGVPAAPPPPSTTDTTTPKPPTTLTFSSMAYLDSMGIPRSVVTASWVAPAQNTDNSVLADLQDYYVSLRKTVAGNNWDIRQVVTGTSAQFDNLDPGSTPVVSVVARDNSGHVSTVLSGTAPALAGDTNGPTQPSTPTPTVYLGAAYIFWNGKTAAGNPMEADFREVQVHLSTVSNFTPAEATKVGVITSRNGGSITTPKLIYGTPYYAKLVPYDNSGNAGTPSSQTTFTPLKLVTTDIGPDQITGEQIADNAIVAGSAIIATAAISSAMIDSLTANKIETGELAAGVRIIAGPDTSDHAELTATGLKIFALSGEGQVEETGSFGSGQANSLAFMSGGTTVASISETGNISGSEISANQDLIIAGESFYTIMDRYPRGLIGYGSRTTQPSDIYATETGILEIQVTMKPGRFYRIYTNPLRYYTTAPPSVNAAVKMRVAWDGSAVTTSSAEVISFFLAQPYQTGYGNIPGPAFSAIVASGGWSAPREVRFLLSASTGSASYYLRLYSPFDIFVEDVGPVVPETGIDRGAPVSTKLNYSSSWIANNSGCYIGNGNSRSFGVDLRVGDYYQAASYATNGDQHALALFTGNASAGETTKTIAQALTGATLTKATLTYFVSYSWGSGGCDLNIRSSTLTTIPGTMSGPTGTAVVGSIYSKTGKVTKDITSIFTTSSRAVTWGKEGDMVNTTRNYAYVGAHNYDAAGYATTNRPVLRLEYTR